MKSSDKEKLDKIIAAIKKDAEVFQRMQTENLGEQEKYAARYAGRICKDYLDLVEDEEYRDTLPAEEIDALVKETAEQVTGTDGKGNNVHTKSKNDESIPAALIKDESWVGYLIDSALGATQMKASGTFADWEICKFIERGLKMAKDRRDEIIRADYIESPKFDNEENCINYLRLSGWMERHDEEISHAEYKRGYNEGLRDGEKWYFDGAAIYHLKESGWMAKHDKEIGDAEYKRGYEEGVATQGYIDGYTKDEYDKAVDEAYLRGYEQRRKDEEEEEKELNKLIREAHLRGFYLKGEMVPLICCSQLIWGGENHEQK